MVNSASAAGPLGCLTGIAPRTTAGKELEADLAAGARVVLEALPGGDLDRTARYNKAGGEAAGVEAALAGAGELVAVAVGEERADFSTPLCLGLLFVDEADPGTKTEENGFSFGGAVVLTEIADFEAAGATLAALALTTSENFFLGGVALSGFDSPS